MNQRNNDPQRFITDSAQTGRESRPESGRSSEVTQKQGTGLLPAISLPKGGGAISGIGEKFSTNPATGTGSLSVPIATSPGRAGFELSLALSYDSGSGNGPFGIGWQLSTPAITRKTDKGLPRYIDEIESDTFILSGAEDLVPVPSYDDNGNEVDTFMRDNHTVKRYRPRVEGLFARIERWTHNESGDIHWRVTTRDNVLNVYGKSPSARISDPAAPAEGREARIFSWLLEETRDDRGNVAKYHYKAEDGAGIEAGLSEFSRFKIDNEGLLVRDNDENPIFEATAHRYLQRIQYGNRQPVGKMDDIPIDESAWLFEVVFDYGEYTSIGEDDPHAKSAPDPGTPGTWAVRQDPHSNYKAAFEIRIFRLCRRVLMLHRFPEEESRLGRTPCLVRSTDFAYEEGPHVTYLKSVTEAGYIWDSSGNQYERATLPSLEFGYTKPPDQLDESLRTIRKDSLVGIPSGVDDNFHRWVDLDGEGIPGVLTASRESWHYKRNLGAGQLGRPAALRSMPSHADLGSGTQLTDLGGDGQLDVVSYASPTEGYFARTHQGDWQPFTHFKSLPNINWNDPNLRFIDIDGDGQPDVLVTEDDCFVWYRSKAKDGFEQGGTVKKPKDELHGPAIVFADGTETIYLADMSGDGLADIVRVRNGEVCYWPNLGYGLFFRKVIFSQSPHFTAPGLFDPSRIRFADIDGSGTTDILYLDADGIAVYLNLSGNRFSAKKQIRSFPPIDDFANLAVVDLLGQGTSCLVWSSSSPADRSRPLTYIDPVDGQKPHLMTSIINNLGAETRISYEPSTAFYLRDRRAGRPWLTRLPFPTQVVGRIERYDYINKSRLVTRFAYHHGYFDGHEREFRGFACVEQWDAESFSGEKGKGLFPEIPYDIDPEDEALNLPPVRTVTWFHTGAWLEGQHLERELANEYYDQDAEAPLLIDTVLPTGLSALEEREAVRALRGRILRQEIYAEDGTAESEHPYTVSERNYGIRMLESRESNRHGVFFVHPLETINLHYERKPLDPRMQQEVVLAVDKFGNVIQSANIGYPRRKLQREAAETAAGVDLQEQSKLWATVSEASFINRDRECDWYRVGLPVETVTWELTGLTAPENPSGATGLRERWRALTSVDIANAINESDELSYEQPAEGTGYSRRLVEAQKVIYLDDSLHALPIGKTGSLALAHETYRLALTDGIIEKSLNHDVDGQQVRIEEQWLRDDCRYIPDNEIPVAYGYQQIVPSFPQNTLWWAPSGHVVYSNVTRAQEYFYLPEIALDPFEEEHHISYDNYKLLPIETRDPVDNLSISDNDYRTLMPWMITDPNNNRTAAAFDALGMVIKTAVMGKEDHKEGDTISDPSAVFEYDLHRWTAENNLPAYVKTRMRERHRDPNTRWQVSFSYTDGSGREVMRKIQAETGIAPIRNLDGELMYDDSGLLVQQHVADRWVGTGRTVFDNKGSNPIKQYEPFFSSTSEYEDERDLVEWGVTPVFRYDPLGRLVRTDQPNGTFTKVIFDVWAHESWDANDTALQSEWYRLRGSPDPAEFEPRARLGERDLSILQRTAEQRSAWLAAKHAETPAINHLDSLGRAFLSIAHNRIERSGGSTESHYQTRLELDIEGNQLSVIDPRGVVVLRQDFDVLGRVQHSSSPDAGDRWNLVDVGDKPTRTWDSRQQAKRYCHDALQRPTHLFVTAFGESPKLVQRTIYGDATFAPGARLNMRGQVYLDYDGAGMIANDEFDFKGNLISSTRRLHRVHREVPDWSPLAENELSIAQIAAAALSLKPESFTISSEYDALNRMVSRITPDQSETRSTYNEANLLEQLDVRLRGADDYTTFVENIDYNARGQRVRVDYGNNTHTTYSYDDETFRLSQLKTLRLGSERLQDLTYTYDPVGNITGIADRAQQTIFFDGAVVEPQCRFRYDAIYQLIEAEGREHPGQQPDHQDLPMRPLPDPNNGQALRRYTERYFYDEVGNIERMAHDAATSGWTRFYAYEQDSYGNPLSNRLLATSLPGDQGNGPYSAQYSYDAHGNMASMPHLAGMNWDYADRLVAVDLDGGGMAYYCYNFGGERVLKVVEKNGLVEERINLGGFEVFRQRSGGTAQFERESLHIMDDQRRVALAESKILEDRISIHEVETPIRYQLDNHLSSTLLELNDDGQVITYEEYFPFGGTAYHAADEKIEVSAKRYRYNGKERDEETGLKYYGVRYHASWIGRWIAPDPAGLVDGPNIYAFALGNPTSYIDDNGTSSSLASETDVIKAVPGPILGDYEGLSSLWQDAANRVLEKKFKGGDFTENLKRFKSHIDSLAADQKTLGSNRKKGTAINVARKTYSRIRTQFGKLAAEAGLDLTGIQIHHGLEEATQLAKAPRLALDADHLILTSGNAGTKGSGHNLLHQLNKKATEHIKRVKAKVRAVSDSLREGSQRLSKGSGKLSAVANQSKSLTKYLGPAAKAADLGITAAEFINASPEERKKLAFVKGAEVTASAAGFKVGAGLGVLLGGVGAPIVGAAFSYLAGEIAKLEAEQQWEKLNYELAEPAPKSNPVFRVTTFN